MSSLSLHEPQSIDFFFSNRDTNPCCPVPNERRGHFIMGKVKTPPTIRSLDLIFRSGNHFKMQSICFKKMTPKISDDKALKTKMTHGETINVISF